MPADGAATDRAGSSNSVSSPSSVLSSRPPDVTVLCWDTLGDPPSGGLGISCTLTRRLTHNSQYNNGGSLIRTSRTAVVVNQFVPGCRSPFMECPQHDEPFLRSSPRGTVATVVAKSSAGGGTMAIDLQATRDVVDVMTGGWKAQALYTAVKLGLPDQVAAGRTTSDELAESTGAHTAGVRRLMRLLVAMGVFDGDETTGYRGTPVSEALRSGPQSMRDMCLLYGEEFYAAWGHAHHSISTVSSGFEVAYGRSFYEYLGEDADTARRFQATMNAGSMFFHHVPDAFDFTGGKTIVDVGGGGGNLLATILAATPDAKGVLFDREHMMPKAGEHLAATVGLHRVTLVGGDMFTAVPTGGDVYILSRALAGWKDDAIVRAFENCHRAMSGPSARLLILDRFVDDDKPSVLPALWDLHLLMTTGGAHRTLHHITELLNRAGLNVERTGELPMEHLAVVAAPRLAS
ncbi:methyltransferase [Micromonospora arborensis]|uniref:methyltransferase n=1 Tax=Micromonospora arborensis TaxID=2116518 RepID=UPI00343A6A83